jgi:hypothetical protein
MKETIWTCDFCCKKLDKMSVAKIQISLSAQAGFGKPEINGFIADCCDACGQKATKYLFSQLYKWSSKQTEREDK